MTYKHGLIKKNAPITSNFSANRNLRLKIDSTYSEEHHMFEVVPQGCVLSYTFCALDIDGCLSNLPGGVNATLCVDD